MTQATASALVEHRLPDRIVQRIEDAIRSAELGSASFDGVSPTDGMKVVVHTKWGTTEWDGSVTRFIREKVRLHHDSWIVAPLRSVLEWSQSTDDGSIREYDLQGRLTGPWPNPAALKEAAAENARLRAENAELRAFKVSVSAALEAAARALQSQDHTNAE